VKQAEPIHYLWWLVSRASGILALVLITLSVLMGLAMATKMLRRPGLKRSIARMHEHLALIALVAIGLHGASLLGDHWLKPGWRGITVPFAMSYRPQFTGVGIIAGYLALLLGPSFYLRRRIGARRWRKLHRMTALVWLLSVLHTLGAGSDGSKLWLRVVVLVPSVPIVYLLMLRLLQPSSAISANAKRVAAQRKRPDPHGTTQHDGRGYAGVGRRQLEATPGPGTQQRGHMEADDGRPSARARAGVEPVYAEQRPMTSSMEARSR
jgi:methionine sulfoxide reductase heme-binding subunit